MILAHASKTENNYFVAEKKFDKNLYLQFSDHVWISACNTTNIDSNYALTYSATNLDSYSSQIVRSLILDGNIQGVPGDQILYTKPVLSILYLRNLLDILADNNCNRWWESNDHPIRGIAEGYLEKEANLRKKLDEIHEDDLYLFPDKTSFIEAFHYGVFVAYHLHPDLNLFTGEHAKRAWENANRKNAKPPSPSPWIPGNYEKMIKAANLWFN